MIEFLVHILVFLFPFIIFTGILFSIPLVEKHVGGFLVKNGASVSLQFWVPTLIYVILLFALWLPASLYTSALLTIIKGLL